VITRSSPSFWAHESTVVSILTRTTSRSTIPYPFTVPPKDPDEKRFPYAFWTELIRMHETPIDATRKREELKAKRNLLFRRFLQNPLETHLALEIKIIDDQVAECAELMNGNTGLSTKLD